MKIMERFLGWAGFQGDSCVFRSRWLVLVTVFGTPAAAQYNEKFETWTASSTGAWQTQSLAGSPYNVPAGSVVEIAIRNANSSTARSAGVRAVGSSLDRRFTVKAATGGGVSVYVMHVQTNASSQIQHYAANTTDVSFVLLGYWDCGTYVETMQVIAEGNWADADLNAYGVAPNGVAEVVMRNGHPVNSYLLGVRTNGSTLERRVSVSSGSVFSMLTKADNSASATIESYSGQSLTETYLVGYWSVAPGAYTEAFSTLSSPSSSGIWQDVDLTGAGVADGNVADVFFGNDDTDEENQMGFRANGSSLSRTLNLRQESSDDGTFARMHVLTDAGAVVEYFHSDINDAHSIRVVGQWNVGTILSDHVASPSQDAFRENGAETNAQMFLFKLAPCGDALQVTQVVFRLTNINGLVNGDWAGIELMVDTDGDGVIEPGETTAVGGAGVVNQAAGTITFSSTFNVTADTFYVLRADFASLTLGDQVTISLSPSDFTASDPVTGFTTPVTHKEKIECYFEAFDVWTASSADTWQTQSLSSFGVPANAVVEIAVRNDNTSNERYGGVRAVGSSLERRILLREAESGGYDVVVMHVQADASSQIEHYSDVTADVDFVLLGYWTCGSYVEAFESFTAGASATWTDRELCTWGVRPGHVAEIVMTNDDPANEREAGVRTRGSLLQRRFNLAEAEDGGVDAVTLFAKADSSASAAIQVYAQDDTDIDFYFVGYWDVAPLAYNELFVDLGSPTSSSTWQDRDLTADGVADTAHAEIVLANLDPSNERNMGIRENGSSLSRFLNLQEAEDGGSDAARLHIASDVTASIEWYHSSIGSSKSIILAAEWASCNSRDAYIVSDLGAVSASRSSLGLNINDSGVVAGFEEDDDGDPTAWRLTCASFTNLGTLGGASAEAHGINASGQIVGWAHNGSGRRRAYRYSGSMTDLGVIGGRTDSEAQAINSASEVVGTAYDSSPTPNGRLAFVYLPAEDLPLSAGMNSLGTLGGAQSQAFDINDQRQIVGGAQDSSGNFRPFRWQEGVMSDLGTLGGESINPDHRAEAINSLGDICGRSYTAGGARHAFLWDGVMEDLGVLTGGSESWAFGINDSLQVVGTSNVSGGAYHAFIWDQLNGMRDLNDLIPVGSGWTLTRATDINNAGEITGWGTNGSGDVRAFLLTPTCAVDGGGAAATMVLASGEGTTDGEGVFHEVILDSAGSTLGELELVAPQSGSSIQYQLLQPTRISQDIHDDPANRPGFADGKALRRMLRVQTNAATQAVLTISMIFDEADIRAIDAGAAELALHYFVTTAEGGHWKPVGTSIGQSSPTAVPGDAGWLRRGDGTIEYWGVQNSGGEFAVGKPMPEVSQPPPRPAPRGCGAAMLPFVLSCVVSLTIVRRWSPASVR